jgi:hypothetical protein
MSATKSSAVVIPASESGAPMPGQAAAVTGMSGGGLVLSPLPLSGGRKRKTKRLSKKVLKMFKKGSAKKLSKLLKGGQNGTEEVVTGETPATPVEGARRRRRGGKTRRGSRKSRHSFLY